MAKAASQKANRKPFAYTARRSPKQDTKNVSRTKFFANRSFVALTVGPAYRANASGGCYCASNVTERSVNLPANGLPLAYIATGWPLSRPTQKSS